ncbi:hypothetical protein M0804_008756 [Polistes exclamans]|nr:hypothetical protein M0804_008756 [Polistes exclamans]
MEENKDSRRQRAWNNDDNNWTRYSEEVRSGGDPGVEDQGWKPRDGGGRLDRKPGVPEPPYEPIGISLCLLVGTPRGNTS